MFAAAILVESALSMLFDWKWWIRSPLNEKGLKTLIAIAASYLLCYKTNFDVLSWWFSAPASQVGMAFTALTIAGGSKKVVKLFVSVKDFKTEVTTTTTTTRGTVPVPVQVPTAAQVSATEARASANVAQNAAGNAQNAAGEAQFAAGSAQDAAGSGAAQKTVGAS